MKKYIGYVIIILTLSSLLPMQAGTYQIDGTYLGPNSKSTSFKKQFSGKYVILDALSTTCSACTIATYRLIDVHEVIQNNDSIKIISLSMDPATDTVRKVEKFMKEYGGNWTYGVDQWNHLSNHLDLISYPTTYIINPEGEVLEKWRGVKDSKEILDILDLYVDLPNYESEETVDEEKVMQSDADLYRSFLLKNQMFIVFLIVLVPLIGYSGYKYIERSN